MTWAARRSSSFPDSAAGLSRAARALPQHAASGLAREPTADRFVGRGVVDGDHALWRCRPFSEQRFETGYRRFEVFVNSHDHVERREVGPIYLLTADGGYVCAVAPPPAPDPAHNLPVELQGDLRP